VRRRKETRDEEVLEKRQRRAERERERVIVNGDCGDDDEWLRHSDRVVSDGNEISVN
jgi:hypothetical protein